MQLKIGATINFNDDDKNELLKFTDNYENVIGHVDCQDINSYINFIVERLFSANKYFNDQEPWNKKKDVIRLNTIIYTSLELIRKITILLYPIIPETTLKVMGIFNYTEKDISFEILKDDNYIKKGSDINKIGILFKKIEKK